MWGWTHDVVMSLCRRLLMVSVGWNWSVSLWLMNGMGEDGKIFIVDCERGGCTGGSRTCSG